MTNWLDKYEQGGLVLKKKTKDNYGTKHNPNDVKVSVGPNFVGLGYNTKGRNYSPAWGGQFQMGGSLPGSVGFMYARTQNPAPSNGKYAKKTQASAQNGTEMKFYQEGLDFKPKSISKNGSVIKDDMGQWAHPGEITQIGSNEITMKGVDYPVLGISDTGDTKMMYPGKDYKFDGNMVTEYPLAQDGENITKKLKKEAEEKLERIKQPKATISQYTPKKGEAERLDREKLQRIAEENAPLNKFARSKAAGNLEDAMLFATDIMGGLEGTAAIKALMKKAPKFALSKASTTVAEDRANRSLKDAVASSIVNKNTGRVQYFNEKGEEIASTSFRSPKSVKEYNQALKTQFRTGATNEPSEELAPKLFRENKNGGWLNKYK